MENLEKSTFLTEVLTQGNSLHWAWSVSSLGYENEQTAELPWTNSASVYWARKKTHPPFWFIGPFRSDMIIAFMLGLDVRSNPVRPCSSPWDKGVWPGSLPWMKERPTMHFLCFNTQGSYFKCSIMLVFTWLAKNSKHSGLFFFLRLCLKLLSEQGERWATQLTPK